MRRILAFFLFAALVSSPRPAAATVIEVPVPGLTGAYLQNGLPEGASQTATVQLPALPSVIHGASLRVHGTTALGLFSCDTQYGMQPYWLQTHTNGSLNPTTGYLYTDRTGDADASGEFGWTEPFVSYGGPTWSFLLDGTCELTIGTFCGSPIPECYKQDPGASLTLDAMTLLIDGEFPTPANVSTWGRIKAQYR